MKASRDASDGHLNRVCVLGEIKEKFCVNNDTKETIDYTEKFPNLILHIHVYIQPNPSLLNFVKVISSKNHKSG